MTKRPTRICFVCLGNICRSPAAEGMFRAAFPGIYFESRGTGAWHAGDPADARSIAVCKKHNISLSGHISRQLSVYDADDFDLFLCMDSANVRDAKSLLPLDSHEKVQLIDAHKNVADPYYNAEKGFQEMYEHLSECIAHWQKMWQKN